MLLLRKFNLITKVSKCSSSNFSPTAILSTRNKESCIANLMKLKPTKQMSKPPTRQAAVLVPLCHVDGKLSLLYTLRAADMKTHRGQVSFPGGMQERGDATVVVTALRETEEELGIDQTEIDVWCPGQEINTPSRTTVTPVLGYIKEPIVPSKLPINKKEVEEAFAVPLERLCASEMCKYTQFRGGFSTPVFFGGKRRIWGLTAVVTHYVLLALIPEGGYYHQNKYLPRFNIEGQMVSRRT